MPETLISTARDWWAIFVGFAGVIVWFVRLEARGKQNSDNLAALERRLERQRAEDMVIRQRDWDAMDARLDVIQADIKELLQRTTGGQR